MLTPKEQKSAETLDAIIVLGGEGRAMKRSEQAATLYHYIKDAYKREVPVITTGYCTGLLPENQRPNKEDAESARAKRYLTSEITPAERMIPEHQIYSEDEGLDTLANFHFAEPILQEMLNKKRKATKNPNEKLNIAVIADEMSRARVVWTAQAVLGPEYDVMYYGVGEEVSAVGKIMTKGVYLANMIDLKLFGCKPGDREKMQKYLDRLHPFYAKGVLGVRNYGTAYGFCVGMLNLFGLKGLYSAVKQHLSTVGSPVNSDK